MPNAYEFFALVRIISRIILEPLENFLLIFVTHPPSVGRLAQSFLIIEIVLTQAGCCSQTAEQK